MGADPATRGRGYWGRASPRILDLCRNPVVARVGLLNSAISSVAPKAGTPQRCSCRTRARNAARGDTVEVHVHRDRRRRLPRLLARGNSGGVHCETALPEPDKRQEDLQEPHRRNNHGTPRKHERRLSCTKSPGQPIDANPPGVHRHPPPARTPTTAAAKPIARHEPPVELTRKRRWHRRAACRVELAPMAHFAVYHRKETPKIFDVIRSADTLTPHAGQLSGHAAGRAKPISDRGGARPARPGEHGGFCPRDCAGVQGPGAARALPPDHGLAPLSLSIPSESACRIAARKRSGRRRRADVMQRAGLQPSLPAPQSARAPHVARAQVRSSTNCCFR